MMRFSLSKDQLRRVNVVGVSGSGKSWFSQRLAERLCVRQIEMDRLMWKPNWTESTEAELRNKLEEAIDVDAWVLDGNYHSKTHDIKWRNVTMVVWIDNSLLRTVWQATCRAICRAWTKTEVWPGTGNRESFRRSFFSRESVVLWTLLSFYRLRRRYSGIASDHSNDKFLFVRLRGRNSAIRFLDNVDRLCQETPSSDDCGSASDDNVSR